MRAQELPASSCIQWFPTISATPRSILAAALSLACVFSLTFELPAAAAIPAVREDHSGERVPAQPGDHAHRPRPGVLLRAVPLTRHCRGVRGQVMRLVSDAPLQ